MQADKEKCSEAKILKDECTLSCQMALLGFEYDVSLIRRAADLIHIAEY
jgi:hypothetical protein